MYYHHVYDEGIKGMNTFAFINSYFNITQLIVNHIWIHLCLKSFHILAFSDKRLLSPVMWCTKNVDSSYNLSVIN